MTPVDTLQRIADKVKRADLILRSGGKLHPEFWNELCMLTNEADAVITAHRKPLVLVTVHGGFAEGFLEQPGSVLLAQYDFDINDVSDPEDHVVLPKLPDGTPDWAAIRAKAEAEG